jgi:flagellar basal-body rod protein FlgG
MIRGIYTSVSGLAAAEARQQVLAHGLANLNTPGYKGEDVTTESFEQIFADIWDPASPGSGAVSSGRKFDLAQGGMTETGARLDVALDGPGFFVLSGPDGDLFTRAGRFTRDTNGVLRSPDGLAVQGADGGPITVRGEAKVLPDGTVLDDGVAAGRLRVVDFEQDTLTRAGTTTFTASGLPAASPARVVSGALENSNVDATATMTALTLLLRAFEAGRQAVQMQNETLGAAVNQVGSLR